MCKLYMQFLLSLLMAVKFSKLFLTNDVCQKKEN